MQCHVNDDTLPGILRVTLQIPVDRVIDESEPRQSTRLIWIRLIAKFDHSASFDPRFGVVALFYKPFRVIVPSQNLFILLNSSL